MQLTLQNALYLILLAQAGFFGLFMLFQKQLFGIGVFFTALSVHMALNLGYENQLLNNWPNLTFTWGLLYPPSLYFYFRELLFRDFKWSHACLWHYLAWFLAVAFVLGGGDLYRWLPVIMPLSVLGYLTAVIYQVYRFKQIVAEQYSSDIKPVIRWSIFILLNYTLIIAFDLVRSLIHYFSPQSEPWMGPLQSVLLLILVNLMLIKRITRPAVFNGISEKDRLLASAGFKNDSSQSIDNAKREELSALIVQLEQLMRQQELFKEPGVTLKDVADALGVHSKKLSIAINQVKGERFTDYIAALRVDAAKQRLQQTLDPVTTIFYEVGFNSKASFNNTFKKIVGETPSQYRASAKLDTSNL
jgi:AraC-like DNA-binding protein